MRARKRILSIRNQSRITIPKEDLWFFSESTPFKQSRVIERKSTRNDELSILNQDYTRYSLDDSGRDRNKKASGFVVDWQMSDAF